MQPQITRLQHLRTAIEGTYGENPVEWRNYPCILWPYDKSPKGYGMLWGLGRSRVSHRLAYEFAYGETPSDYDIVQECGDRLCFRPCHLRTVPPRIEYLRAAVASCNDDPLSPWDAYPCVDWPFILNEHGYGIIVLAKKFVRVTRIAYELKHGPFDKALDVLHRCDRPCCFRWSHLWLGTAKDNAQDMLAKGRGNARRGERHPHARLTWNEVVEIRRLRKEHGLSITELGRRFNANTGTVSMLIRGLKWKHPR